MRLNQLSKLKKALLVLAIGIGASTANANPGADICIHLDILCEDHGIYSACQDRDRLCK